MFYIIAILLTLLKQTPQIAPYTLWMRKDSFECVETLDEHAFPGRYFISPNMEIEFELYSEMGANSKARI